MPPEDEFAKAVRERLPQIDQILADQNMRLGVRPLNAAIHFVEYWILDIKGGTKDEFWNQRWFAILFWHIRNWYKEFYGERLDSSKERLPGIVFINGTPFKLSIGATRSEVEEPGKSAWLVFPVGAHATETLDGWFESPPNLSVLARNDREALEAQVLQIIAATRGLNLDLMTAELSDDVLQVFRSSIVVHLENAVNAATRNSQESMSVAMWELHLMTEKSIKLVLKQRGACPNTHDLAELRALVDAIVDSSSIGEEFKNTLPKSQAIAFRYCDGGLVSADAFFKLYLSSLAIAAFYAEQLQRSMSVRNGRILLKKPPWLELPDA